MGITGGKRRRRSGKWGGGGGGGDKRKSEGVSDRATRSTPGRRATVASRDAAAAVDDDADDERDLSHHRRTKGGGGSESNAGEADRAELCVADEDRCRRQWARIHLGGHAVRETALVAAEVWSWSREDGRGWAGLRVWCVCAGRRKGKSCEDLKQAGFWGPNRAQFIFRVAEKNRGLHLLVQAKFSHWRYLLGCKFSVLVWGLGSKKALLRRFAESQLRDGSVIYLDGYDRARRYSGGGTCAVRYSD